MTFRLGFVTGSTPDKWARQWRDRSPENITLEPLTESEQEEALHAGEVDLALVRLPVDATDLHVVRLYEEEQVVVAGRDHFIAAADVVTLADLDDEQLVLPERTGWSPVAEQLPWPPMDEKDAIETVAAGTGVVIVPASIARLFHRKDVVVRTVTDLPPTVVAAAWLRSRDDERTQAFVGITRGRTAKSSRG